MTRCSISNLLLALFVSDRLVQWDHCCFVLVCFVVFVNRSKRLIRCCGTGEKGHRVILPNARVMVHQPSGGAEGQASGTCLILNRNGKVANDDVVFGLDIAIHAEEILKTRKILNNLYHQHTGQTLQVIEKVMERDYFMSAEEAVKFGIVDKVIEKRGV